MTSLAFLASPRLRRHYRDARHRLSSLAAKTDDDWQSAQLEAVQRVWSDAIGDIPYYADMVAAGQAPKTIRSWADVQCIPALTRRNLQEAPERFVRRSRRAQGSIATAGSTGVPLSIGMDDAERDLMRLVKLSEWVASGYTPSSRLFLLWGHSHLLGTGARGRFNHVKRVLADRVLGYRRVDAYRLGPSICASYADALIAFRPTGVIGYAAALDLFARHTEVYRPQFRALGVRFVMITAEPPPRTDTVARLEDLFGCGVVEEYGGAEFGQVAFRRGHEPFRTYHDLNYVECARGPSDDEGETVLVTSLYPRYLPLIRYQVGDALAGVRRMAHGHIAGFQRVAGRINDVIVMADGDAIHSVAVFHCVHKEPDVHSIQMVVDDDGVEVVLVAATSERAPLEERVRRRLAQVHPSLAGARFRFVEDLETTRAGKRRWFVDRRTRAVR